MSRTTLTPAKARTDLPRVLRRALKGDDIGIVMDGRIVALRPVPVESTDYAGREYGLTPVEMETAEKNTTFSHPPLWKPSPLPLLTDLS